MLAQFSIYPTDATHMSRDVARLMEILDGAGVAYHLGALSTAVEGDWDEVMDAIRQCRESMLKEHDRVITTITLDDRRQQTLHLEEMVGAVEQRLGRPAHSETPRRANQPVDELC